MSKHLVIALIGVFLIGVGIAGPIGFGVSSAALLGLLICTIVSFIS